MADHDHRLGHLRVTFVHGFKSYIISFSLLFLPDNLTLFKNHAPAVDGMADVPYEGKVFANE